MRTLRDFQAMPGQFQPAYADFLGTLHGERTGRRVRGGNSPLHRLQDPTRPSSEFPPAATAWRIRALPPITDGYGRLGTDSNGISPICLSGAIRDIAELRQGRGRTARKRSPFRGCVSRRPAASITRASDGLIVGDRRQVQKPVSAGRARR